MDQAAADSIKLLKKMLESGKLTRGAVVSQAEEKLRQVLGHPYVSLLSSGTGAIHAGLLALDLQPGDEVITISYTFSAPLNMILATGATAVLIDQDPSYRLDVNQLETAITPRTKGIVTVDLFGLVNDYAAIAEFAHRHDLWIVADACQSLGSSAVGLYPALAHCEVVAGSFFETKQVSTGEGGVVLTKDQPLLDRVNMFASHGQPRGVQYEYEVIGYNYRPTDVQAAILLPKLAEWRPGVDHRWSQLQRYLHHLQNVNGQLQLPHFFATDLPAVLPIRVPATRRQQLLDRYLQAGVVLKQPYPRALHQYPVYQSRVVLAGELTNSQVFGTETVLLPLGSRVDDQQIDHLCQLTVQALA